MVKFDPSVKREIGYVTLGTLILTAAEIGVFFLLGRYTPEVLYGAVLSAAGGILNFFLLAVTVTRVLSYSPEEEPAAKGLLKLSRIARMTFLLAVLAVGVILFNRWSTLITIIFPRIIIGVRTVAVKRETANAAIAPAESEPDGDGKENAETESDTDAPDEGDAEDTLVGNTEGGENDGTDGN